MAIETPRFDVLDHLKTPEDRFAHLKAAFDDGDPSPNRPRVGDVARSIGMTAVAKHAGVSRDALSRKHLA